MRENAFRPWVAVVIRLPQEFSRLGKEHVIDAPRVDANRDDPLAEARGPLGEAFLNLRPEPQHVPAQRVAQGNGTVGKAVRLLDADAAAVEQACHHAAAFGTEVDAEKASFRHFLPSLRCWAKNSCSRRRDSSCRMPPITTA